MGWTLPCKRLGTDDLIPPEGVPTVKLGKLGKLSKPGVEAPGPEGSLGVLGAMLGACASKGNREDCTPV